jgi:very-short-patch-repair endonuclease
MDGWRAAEVLGARQRGVITAQQLRNLGFTKAAIAWLLQRGRLIRMFVSVYRFPFSPQTWEQKAQGAMLVLGKGSALSHQSAALLWGLGGIRRSEAIHVSVPPHKRSVFARPIRIHRTKLPFVVQHARGLQVTSLARTLIDCAAELEDEALEMALDSAQHRHGEVLQQLLKVFDRLVPQSVRGLSKLKHLVDLRRGMGPESPLETLVRRRLRAEGLEPPVLQRDLFDAAGFIMRVDFAWPAERVAVHADGFRWHANRATFDLDAQQRTRLAALGWVCFAVTSTMVRGDWTKGLRAVLDERSLQHRFAWG